MRLSELLKMEGITESEDGIITGLTADSREVKPGFLFAALGGTVTDGQRYINMAIDSGAAVILTARDYDSSECAVYCHKADNPRRELAFLAGRYFGSMPKTIVAVTGTNGKTSVAHFVRAIWQEMGLKAASLGTLGVITQDRVDPLHYTTPEPVLLHQTLANLAVQNVTHAVIEASSHGLDQNRLDAVPVAAGGFTNLTHDHLDYHAGTDDYLAAKLGLVNRVTKSGGCAVLNADSEHYFTFAAAAKARGLKVINYGRSGEDFKLLDVSSHGNGQQLTLQIEGNRDSIDLQVAGEFQAMNILCALGLVVGAGGALASALAALPKIANVPGRMELVVKTAAGAGVYVDYAHTPDALETVLKALRPHTQTRLLAIVGCGGDRDKAKRPLLGRIARDHADLVYVTDDNPRTEDPATIRSEILAACPNAKEIGDRRRAIEIALTNARDGDIVLIAGKGHEDGQVIGRETIPFNDKDVALEIAAHLGDADA